MEEFDVADADGADGIAMVSQLQMEKRVLGAGIGASLLPVLDRHFERDFDRRRSIIGIKYTRQSFGCDLNQGPRELNRRRIGESEQGGMRNLIQLLLDRTVERRITVAMQIDPDGRNPIEIPLPFRIN